MVKKTLIIEYDYDFVLLGISCHEKDYRLCHEINVALKAAFKKQDDLEITLSRQKETSAFSLYQYHNRDGCDFYVIANKGTKGFLIPEQKQVDYFLVMKPALHKEDKMDVLKKVKKIHCVLGTYEFNPEKLKSRQNLIF